MNWNLGDLAHHLQTADKAHHENAVTIRRVSTDSREVLDDSTLFVALRGEFHDGHDHAAAAVEAGAGAVMVERDLGLGNQLVVEDTLIALAELSALRRSELQMPVIGITGSSGKTSTKDLISAALGDRAHASPRSFNNEIGVPLTVLSCPDDASALVVEVGSRGPGHIASLIPAFRPTLSVITLIGVAHSEFLPDEQDVREAKFELANGTEGSLVLPGGDGLLLEMAADRRVITFGSQLTSPAGADFWATEVGVDKSGKVSFRLVTPDVERHVALSVAGLHNAHNAAAAVAVAWELGIPVEESVARLESASLSAWRMEVHRGSFTVVNDAYNANPDSLSAALRTVAAMGEPRMAVLGPMEELGSKEEAEHKAVGALARELDFEVVVIGPDRGYGADRSFPDVEAALAELKPRTGDVVLVKASRSAGLDRLADGLVRAMDSGAEVVE